MCPWETGTPFVQQFTFWGVDDDVIGGVVGEKDEMPFAGGDNPVAILDRGLLAELTPSGYPTVKEIFLSENGLLSTRDERERD